MIEQLKEFYIRYIETIMVLVIATCAIVGLVWELYAVFNYGMSYGN